MNRRGFIKALFGGSVAVVAAPVASQVGLFDRFLNLFKKSRRPRRGWKYESVAELKSQFQFDAEAELTKLLSQEISREIDAEVLAELAGVV